MTPTTRTRILLASLTIAAAAAWTQAEDPPKPAPKYHALVYDFVCRTGTYGAQIADSIRLRLRRHKEYEVMARLDVQDYTEPQAYETDTKKVIEQMKQMAMNVAIYGTVTKSGSDVTAKLRCVDISSGKPVTWEATFRDSTERARGLIAKALVEKLRGQAEWKPPEYGDEVEPKKFGKPVNRNGTFEAGRLGWDEPDGVSTFIEKGPAGRGKILRVRTDLARDPWLQYKRDLLLGKRTTANPPKIRTDTSYGSVAGLEGVHFASDWLPSPAGQRYWLTCDANKAGGTPKIFVKGFLDWTGRADGLPESSLAELGLTPKQFARLPDARKQKLVAADCKKHPERYRRECYRWYLNLRGPSKQWHHYAAVCPPRGGMPDNVQWLQLQIYSYWPPGTYLWDNVHFYKDPRQKAPVAVEGARTKNFGKTSDVVERLEAIRDGVRVKEKELSAAVKAGDKPKADRIRAEIAKLKAEAVEIVTQMRKYQEKDE